MVKQKSSLFVLTFYASCNSGYIFLLSVYKYPQMS